MQATVTIFWDLLHCAEGQLLSYDGEKIRWFIKFLCNSSETLHTKHLGPLATEMLFKCALNTQSTQRRVTYATKIVQENKNILLMAMERIAYSLFDANTLSMENN